MSELAARKAALEEKFGPWTAHNIALAPGCCTMSERPNRDAARATRVVQAVADVLGRPLAGLRVLDLACFEGLFAIEFALQGAAVVGVEGREANIEKAKFAAEQLGLANASFHREDVRRVSVERFGRFDVVLCLGLLYHLDAPDQFPFLSALSAMADCLVIETHVTPITGEALQAGGDTYWYRAWREHDPGTSPEERAQCLWSSLDNVTSVVLSKPALVRMLARVGYTSVFECWYPGVVEQPDDRVLLVALRGARVQLRAGPAQDPAALLPDERRSSWFARFLYRLKARRWTFRRQRPITAVWPLNAGNRR